MFQFLQKSETGSSRDLYSVKTNKLSESYNISRTPQSKLMRTPTITTSAESHLITTLNSKHGKKKSALSKQATVTPNGMTPNRAPSFVTKHFQIQRRKTIHDIVNLEILNNIISTEYSVQTERVTSDSPVAKHKSQLSLIQDGSVQLNKVTQMQSDEKLPHEATREDTDAQDEPGTVCQRTLIKKSHVLLVNVRT